MANEMAMRTSMQTSIQSTVQSPFTDFLGKYVKAPYNDGGQIKVARGKLAEVSQEFVKIVGRSGTIIINSKNIEKMSRVKE